MKILRYLDSKDRIHFAAQAADGSAGRLEGDLFTGLSPTREAADVRKLLAPLTNPVINEP